MQGKSNWGSKQISSSNYSDSFRDHVARDYESSDLSHAQITAKYGLPSKELSKWWVRCYRKKGDIEPVKIPPMTDDEQRENEALKKRLAELEKQLAARDLKILGLETLMEVAEKELEVDIRKKSGTKQSGK